MGSQGLFPARRVCIYVWMDSKPQISVGHMCWIGLLLSFVLPFKHSQGFPGVQKHNVDITAPRCTTSKANHCTVIPFIVILNQILASYERMVELRFRRCH